MRFGDALVLSGVEVEYQRIEKGEKITKRNFLVLGVFGVDSLIVVVLYVMYQIDEGVYDANSGNSSLLSLATTAKCKGGIYR